MRTDNSARPVKGLLEVIFHGPVRTVSPRIRYGNLLRVRGKIRPPEDRGNPGEVSKRERLAARGVYLQVRLYHASQVELLERCPPLSPPGLAFRLRRLFQESIEKSLPDRFGHPGSLYSVLLGGLLLGDKSQIPYRIRDNFRKVGAIHILVVSGLHVGFIWLLVDLLFCWVPLRWRQLIIIPTIVLYVLMTGPVIPPSGPG
jgi:competence protein ComEC